MSRFVLKFKLRGRANRDRPDEVVERPEIVLGSRPLADVYVADRLVPQEAIVFHFDGAHLSLEVRGRLAGVFVDGAPVDGRGPVRPGATVQVGHALVECAVDAAKGECTLTTNEQYLPQIVDGIVMKAKPAKPFALTDSGPQEQRWGKSPVLRRANWIAAALGLSVLAAFPFVKDTDAMTRGTLYDRHRIGAPGGPKGCADCHDPFSSDYTAKCAVCHKGFDATATHPYAKSAGVSCNRCHAEHVFADPKASILPPMQKSDAGWPQTCLTCHGPGKDATAMPPAAGAIATAKTRLRDQRGEPFERQLLVDGFSHKDHRVPSGDRIASVPGGPPKKGQAPVACGECHKLLAAGATNAAIPTAEFAPVRYDQCLECHAEWRVAIHGRDEDSKACIACHAGTTDVQFGPHHLDFLSPQMKTADLPATDSKWVLKPRAHDFQKDECLKCHVLSKSSPDHRTAIGEKVFRHDHHLRTVTPPDGGELAYSQECRKCHDAVAGSTTLAGTAIVDTKSCAECHVDSEPTPVPVKEGATRRVTDMFHKVHTVDAASLSRSALRYASRDSLAKGCLACHTPSAGEGPMGFKDGAKDCKACHTGHENLGEGKCVLCHVDRTPGVNRELNGRLEFRFSEPGIFNPAKATKKTTAAMKPFDHRSPGHANHECTECHAKENVDGATRVLDVAWPAFDEDACVKCHVAERYHR
jgi:hypothetical protein